MKKRQFSMVEMITVVAVMSTLTVMLITSVKSSKEVAMSANCMSNLNQIRAITELHRKDNGSLPYTETWLVDFTWAGDYIDNGGLAAFICPGSDDEALTSKDQLLGGTSYYYVPSVQDLIDNLGDDSGVSFLDIPQLENMEQLVIYDKSPDHHNGKVNAAYLYSDDENKADLEGRMVVKTDITAMPYVDGSGNLVLEDPESYGMLNINPANSDGNLFTLTDTDGNEFVVRDDSESVGKAVEVEIKVKAQGKTLKFGDESIDLKTNTTYTISAVGDDEVTDEDAYFMYELSQDGNGTGQWWLSLFQGAGLIEVSGGGTTTVLGDGNNGITQN